MAHKLFFNEKAQRHSMFSVQEKPWHGLGVVLPKKVNSEEAIKEALLNYTVDKIPVKGDVPGFGLKELKDRYITYRTDTGHLFGTVGSRYEIVQNVDAFEFFDAIVGKGEAIYETAGCLYDGEVVFITAKLPDYIKVGKDDLLEKYIFLQSTHDRTGSIIAAFSPVRIVCCNTLNAALRNCTNKVSIRHTKDAVTKLKQAHRIMGISNKLTTELDEIFNQMAKKTIVDKDLKKYIGNVMMPPKKEAVEGDKQKKEELSTRFKNKVNSIYKYALSHPTQQTPTTRGTLFGAYNAITGYFQNVKSYKVAEDKLSDIFGGQAERTQQKALEMALVLL